MKRVLAIDPGERRWGLAVSDPTGRIALPLEVYERVGWREDVAYLRAVIARYGAGELVVGRPLTARGGAGVQAGRAARLAARLREALRLPVTEVDERFSTAAAERTLRAGGVRSRQRRARRDAIAAALILQPYLDRRGAAAPLQGQGEGVMLAP
ncbi:MAG: Holliday junction resolvase RuvX [Armatimonadota bacterium]|nr:Holliday junction resolvase RuvX [Armatimonadota bacterium]